MIDPVDPGWKRKPRVFMVDDQRWRRIEGGGLGFLAPTFLFERDAGGLGGAVRAPSERR